MHSWTLPIHPIFDEMTEESLEDGELKSFAGSRRRGDPPGAERCEIAKQEDRFHPKSM
jgi:hypothetical protein